MADRLVNGVRLHVEESGEGEETILFSHGLLWSTRMYAPQIEHFRARYRCVAWDHRGQGRSEVPAGDEVSIETCYEDALALIESLDRGPCHFVGLSMGGFVGMRLAARRPELLRSLTLIETAADPEPAANLPKYRLLTFLARHLGVGAVASKVMPILFAESFLAQPEQAAFARREMLRNRNSVYKAVNGVIRRRGCESEVRGIRVPTRILHGDEDRAIVRQRAEALHALIADSQLVFIPRAGHSSTVENSAAINAEIDVFLKSLV